MKRVTLSVAFSALVVIGCSDEKAADVTEPEAAPAAAVAVPAPTTEHSVLSTVCISYQQRIASTDAALKAEPGNGELAARLAFYQEVFNDACN